MKEINSNNFGLLIAYLVPGFVALWGIGIVSPTVANWLTVNPDASPTIGGFLFGTIAAVAAGLVVNAIRWHIVDPLHYASGVPRKNWDYSKLPQQMAAFQFLVSNQFRYYECYANMMVAFAFTSAIWMGSTANISGNVVAVFLCVELVLWNASRRTLKNYHLRIAAFLRQLDAPQHREPESVIDPRRFDRYTGRSTVRRRVIFPFLVRRRPAPAGIRLNNQ